MTTIRGPRDLHRETWVARLAFAALILGLPFQMAVSRVMSEPYPALYQPSFGSSARSGDTLRIVAPVVHVSYADGSRATFDHSTIMADATVARIAVFNSAFPVDDDDVDPQASAWLESRVEELAGDRAAQNAVIAWTRTERNVDGSGPVVKEKIGEIRLSFDGS